MKNCLLIILFFSCISLQAQPKLTFTYDGAGNQITRILCINCVSSAKSAKEIETITENDLEKFFPQDLISYYPNPVKEDLYLKWEIANDNYVTSVRVFSVSGQLIRNYDVNSTLRDLTIPFQTYASGMYLVLLSYKDGGEKSIKIIKQ